MMERPYDAEAFPIRDSCGRSNQDINLAFAG